MNGTNGFQNANSKQANNADLGPMIKKMVIAAVVIAAVLIVVLNAFVIVPAGSTGVVITLGKVSDNVYQEGLHFKAPFVQDVEIMSNKIQVYESGSSAVSKDLQTVSSTIAVNYRIGLDSSASIYKNIGREYESIVLMPAVQESVKSVTARYTAEQMITERGQVGEEIKAMLETKVSEYGIFIEKFNIVNFDFSEEFNAAIEAKQVAEQNLLKTQTEQEQAIVIAKAEAEKKVIAAEAEANAILAKAEAQATANEEITKSLSELLLQYQMIENWDGELPKVTDGNPFISFDLEDLEGSSATAGE